MWLARQADGGRDIYDDEIGDVEHAIIARLEVLAALQARADAAYRARLRAARERAKP